MLSRWRISLSFVLVFLVFLLYTGSPFERYRAAYLQPFKTNPHEGNNDNKFKWATVQQQFPVTSVNAVPTSTPKTIPTLQYAFGKETAKEREIRTARLDQVKGNFTHAWKGYKDHAWLRDEVMPISGGSQDPFGGWAATLVDSLGT